MKKYILFLFALVITSCSKDDFSEQNLESKVIVEGWIEEGDYAQVFVIEQYSGYWYY